MPKITPLAPGLLLSMPQLDDPNFTRAVILMVEHNDEGSFGLIVNQETPLKVSELLSGLKGASWAGDPSSHVWSGGPVMPGSGWVLHSGSREIGPSSDTLSEALDETGTVEVSRGVVLSTSENNIRTLATHPPTRSRFLLGYSGWGGGQLAKEMASGSWLFCEIDRDILFDCPSEEMWKRSLGSMGLSPESIVQARGVH